MDLLALIDPLAPGGPRMTPSDKSDSASRTYAVAMKPEWNEVVVCCPICGEAVELNVKADDEHEYWGKAGYCHQVTATYTPSEGKLEVVAFYERAEHE